MLQWEAGRLLPVDLTVVALICQLLSAGLVEVRSEACEHGDSEKVCLIRSDARQFKFWGTIPSCPLDNNSSPVFPFLQANGSVMSVYKR